MQLITMAEVDSTNNEARRLMEVGYAPGFALSAERQTAGRGRMHRPWQTLPGNLSLTITAPWELGRRDGPTIALATGLAIHRTIAEIVGASGAVSIKWPNDVLVDGRKIAGTLIEVDGTAICVGIGINVAVSPDLDGYPVTRLRDFAACGTGELTDALLTQWKATHETWRADGYRRIRPDYDARLHFMDQAMRLSIDRDKQTWISGLCRGTDENGRLVIEDADGIRTAYAVGDVDRPAPGLVSP